MVMTVAFIKTILFTGRRDQEDHRRPEGIQIKPRIYQPASWEVDRFWRRRRLIFGG